jgi:hypothetical protein
MLYLLINIYWYKNFVINNNEIDIIFNKIIHIYSYIVYTSEKYKLNDDSCFNKYITKLYFVDNIVFFNYSVFKIKKFNYYNFKCIKY